KRKNPGKHQGGDTPGNIGGNTEWRKPGKNICGASGRAEPAGSTVFTRKFVKLLLKNGILLFFFNLLLSKLIWKLSPQYSTGRINAPGRWTCRMKARCCLLKRLRCYRKHRMQNLWMCVQGLSWTGWAEFPGQWKSSGSPIPVCAITRIF